MWACVDSFRYFGLMGMARMMISSAELAMRTTISSRLPAESGPMTSHRSGSSPSSAQYCDHYEDVAHAVAWVSQHISVYGGDPNRFDLHLGHRAGEPGQALPPMIGVMRGTPQRRASLRAPSFE